MRKTFNFTFVKEHSDGMMVFATPCVPGYKALNVWRAIVSGDAVPTHCGTPKFKKNVSYRFFICIDTNDKKVVSIEPKRRFHF